MLEMLVYLKCNLRLLLKKLIVFGIIKLDYIFLKFSRLDLGLGLNVCCLHRITDVHVKFRMKLIN